MDLSSRSSYSYNRRNDAIARWNESDSGKASNIRNVSDNKIKFENGAMILAAVAAGDTEESLRLIRGGADVNYANIDGLTSLHQACIDENLPMVKLLVDNGAFIDPCDNEAWTPLHAAASSTSLEIIRYLLSKGANLTAVNSEGQLPVDLAEHPQIQRFLDQEVQKRGINLEDARNAEYSIMLKDANQWLEKGKVDDVRDLQGATPLHIAACKGYLDVLKILLSAGADPNAVDCEGWTPLHAAVYWKNLEIIEELLSYGANLYQKNYTDDTPLSLADSSINDSIKEMIIKYRIDDKKDCQLSLSPSLTKKNVSPKKTPPSGILKAVKLTTQPAPTSVTIETKEQKPPVVIASKMPSLPQTISKPPEVTTQTHAAAVSAAPSIIKTTILRPPVRQPIVITAAKPAEIKPQTTPTSVRQKQTAPITGLSPSNSKLPHKQAEICDKDEPVSIPPKEDAKKNSLSNVTPASAISTINSVRGGSVSLPPKPTNILTPSGLAQIRLPPTVAPITSTSVSTSIRTNPQKEEKKVETKVEESKDVTKLPQSGDKKDPSPSSSFQSQSTEQDDKLAAALSRISTLEQEVIALKKERDCLLKLNESLRIQLKPTNSTQQSTTTDNNLNSSMLKALMSKGTSQPFVISRPPQNNDKAK